MAELSRKIYLLFLLALIYLFLFCSFAINPGYAASINPAVDPRPDWTYGGPSQTALLKIIDGAKNGGS